MNARCDAVQPSRLRVPAASRGEDCHATSVRRDAAQTRRRGRLRYDQRRLVAELDAILDRAFKGEL